ncbi:MAG TPA: DNA polymerase I [Bryobacteraceae bacterium]|nr:DNA polymerase I [Bryobacteraceae bacterium]
MPRLFLIDTFGFIFRAFHARARTGAPPMRTSTGISTEAVYILHNMVRKLRQTYKPEYIAAVYESLGPSFRSEEFADYKANREETPQDLLDQIPRVKQLLQALRIPVLEYERYEADDVIGTLACQARREGMEAVIVSSDKDMLQLVGDGVTMLNPAKDDATYDRDGVKEFMGVWPEQIADFLALVGDSVDNIPGVPGIGKKGAADLLAKYGSVAGLLEHLGDLKPKQRQGIEDGREVLAMSQRLATIATDVPLGIQLADLAAKEADRPALEAIYRELEFFTFLRELGDAPEEAPEDYGETEDLAAYAAGAAVVGVAAFDGHVGVALQAGMARQGPEAAAGAFLESSQDKVVHDWKALLTRFPTLQGVTRDVMLECFLLTADGGNAAFDSMCQVYLGKKPGARADQRADMALRLAGKLDISPFADLYRKMDLPLVPVLAEMERTGVRIDSDQLGRMSGRMLAEIDRLTAEIHGLAGREFNINSPQQLGKVLFEEMGLPSGGKTGKGKQISTAADVLEGLALDYPICAKVLEYRGLVKLRGTYVEALPLLVRPDTGRVHTTFNQTGAATGRLSSINPNLQNIPVRTELGREIRAAFVPRPGWKLVVADYSQIELRLLAHMSLDPVLVEAFQNGEDIHTRTAAEVFGASPMFVTPDMRRSAKAVNFGIVYGQTSFGLAAALGIPRGEADKYIRNYFARYSGVKQFIDATIAKVRETGYAETLYGRRRPIPDISAKNPNVRGFAERTAVNTPLQGTAADLIKVAMIRIHAALREAGMEAKMILQVHDELVFEAPPAEVERLRVMVKEMMEGVRELAVPLVVEVGEGVNWRDAK